MRLINAFIDTTLFSCILKACGILGFLEIGEEIDVEIRKRGLLREDVVLGTTLVDMYAKCGAPEKAQDIFRKLPVRNTITWTALLSGYAQLGQADVVLHLYRKARMDGIVPNLVTFVVMLSACSHAGLLERGPMFFDAIDNNYDLIPNLKHCTCIVDLLGRAGLIDKAAEFINNMPLHPDIAVWLILLGACRKWNNVDLGRYAFEHAVQLSESDSTAYVCMSNIYMNASTQEAQPEKVGLFKAFHTWMQNTQTDEVLGWD